MRSKTKTFFDLQQTEARTKSELLFIRLDSLISDISSSVHDEDWGQFTSETYEKWLEGAEGMKAILAMQHLLEEPEND